MEDHDKAPTPSIESQMSEILAFPCWIHDPSVPMSGARWCPGLTKTELIAAIILRDDKGEVLDVDGALDSAEHLLAAAKRRREEGARR